MRTLKIIFGILFFTGILLPFFISAESEFLDKKQIKDYLSISENDSQQIIHTLIQQLSSELSDIFSSTDRNPREDGAIATLSQSIKINSLKFLLLDAPVEIAQKVVLTTIKIAKTAYGITDLSDVMSIIEKETAKRAVEYGLNALLTNDIRAASGALEINFESYKKNQQKVIFQYVITLKPNPDKTAGIAIAILSKDYFEPPISTYKTRWRYDNWITEGNTQIEPFIMTVQGQIQRGDFDAYYWQGAPIIAISFPDNVPDLGFRPLSFWQRHLWKPIESQIREITVVLDKLMPGAGGIVNNIENIGQKIYQAGSTIKSATTNLFGKINNYFQDVNTGVSIAGFIYPDLPIPDLADTFSNNSVPAEQLTINIEPPESPKPILQDEVKEEKPTDQLALIEAQLKTLIEQIDDIAEETDALLARQNSQAQTASIAIIDNLNFNDIPVTKANDDIEVLPPEELTVETTTPNQTQTATLTNQLTSNQSTTVPPPITPEIIISEVKTESQNSAKDEYIELYNPNKFAVNLGGFILRKKTNSGPESTLVSSAKFKGTIPAFGYFLITSQATTTDNLQYSGASYYIAQTNSVFLYDKYERLVAKAENIVHPATHSFGRQSPSASSDFEAQLPTPGADNQRDTEAPQIIFIASPPTAASSSNAAFTFSANEPGCSFEYQLDNDPWQQSDNDPVAVSFKKLNIGPHTFQIRAEDPVGNWANPLQYAWEIVAAPAVSEPKLLISEVQTESAADVKNEFIELFNPNNFNVDLSGFGLKKKTSGGGESNLVSSSYFTGVIAPFGYFLITPQSDAAGDINYSTDTYLALNNTVILYSNNSNLIDKVGFGSAQDFETAPAVNHPKGYTLGRKWLSDTQTYQDAGNNQDDFEIQIPTPGTKNEKDLIPPETGIVSKPSALTNQSQATFSFSSNEPSSTFQCNLNSQKWQACSSPITYAELPDGLHTFQVKAVDPAENLGEPVEYTWTVDTSIASPFLLLSDPDSNSIFYANNQTVKAEITQDEDALSWFLSKNPEKPTAEDTGWLAGKPSDFNLSGNDGIKTVFVWTKDIAGNVSQLGNFASIILDTTPPETVIEQSPDAFTSEAQAAFAFSSNEAEVDFLCRLDDSDWQGCASSTVFGNLNEGTHSLEVKTVDLAFNVDESPAQYNWLIEPPTPEPSQAVLEIFIADSTSTAPFTLVFSAVQGAENPPSQGLIIQNSGEAEMAWNISFASNWITTATTSGVLLGNSSTCLEISVNVSILDAGSYQATSTIEAEDSENSPQTIQINLNIEELPNQEPSAAFSYSPSENLLLGDEIIFDASSSTDPDGEVADFIWDFGDSSTTTSQSPIINHIFNAIGQFQILLTVQDDKMATSSPISTTLIIQTRPESSLLITEVQTRDDASATNDFIEIFNPTDQDIDISSFQLKKQTSSGTSTGYSIRVFPDTSVIPANGYFLWANTGYSFPDSFIPDATSTQTLANNNSVALFYSDHATIIDQVAWGDSAEPFAETTPFPQNPGEGQTITRQKDGSGDYIDTNNNANDFILASSTPTNSQGQTIAASAPATSTPATSTPATSTPATSTPATTTPAYDPLVPVISDLEAAAGADRNAVDLWWSNVNASEYLINYSGQTTHFVPSDLQDVITATIGDLTGGVNATFTVQYVNAEGATSGPSNIAAAAPLLGFQDNGDGTVSDLYSGLMWPKDGAGLATDNGQPLSWFEAKDFCEQLTAYGHDDWRLPNIKELASIIKYQKSPADGLMIDANYFQNIAAEKYWSTSFEHYAWGWNLSFTRSLDFSNGFIDIETLESTSTAPGYFLPVRGDSTVIATSGFDEPPTGCSLGYQANDIDASFIDLCSGLMWTPSFGDTTFWVDAVKKARDSTIFGHNDWRLPNIREMLMIINNPYQGGSDLHWAITPDYQNPSRRWVIDAGSLIYIGQTQTRPNSEFRYFRFVRDP